MRGKCLACACVAIYRTYWRTDEYPDERRIISTKNVSFLSVAEQNTDHESQVGRASCHAVMNWQQRRSAMHDIHVRFPLSDDSRNRAKVICLSP